MKLSLQIFALTLVCIVVAETSILVALYSKAIWMSALLGVLAFVGLFVGLVLRDRDWMPVIFTKIYIWSFVSNLRAAGTVAVCFLATLVLGTALLLLWPRPQLTVQIFSKGHLPSYHVSLATLHVAWINREVLPASYLTDEQGIVRVPVNDGDRVFVRVETEWMGKLQIGGSPAHKYTQDNDYLEIVLTGIARDSWQPVPQTGTGQPIFAIIPPIQQIDRDPHLPVNIGPSGVIWDGAGVELDDLRDLGLPISRLSIERTGHILSYNTVLKIPNWAAFVVNSDPDISRPKVRFRSDPMIPQQYSAVDDDYRGSGYARGHVVSSSEIDGFGIEISKQVFSFANTTPQVQNGVNGGAWLKVERYSAELDRDGNQVFALGGPLFLEADLTQAKDYLAIGENAVAVPTHYFRVLAIKDQVGTWRKEAFLVPNDTRLARSTDDHTVKLQFLEKLLGYDVFPNTSK